MLLNSKKNQRSKYYVNVSQTKKAATFVTAWLFSAPDGSWTRTTVAGHRILSPACLPVPPPGHPCAAYPIPANAETGKKIPPYSGTVFQSGRPGSNRPPRPWQGRALPNELLPLMPVRTSFRFWECKNSNLYGIAKFLMLFFTCIRVYTAYCPALPHQVYPGNASRTIYNNHLLKMQ